MKEKAFAIAVILVAFLAISTLPIAFAANGPKTPNMQIHIYLDPDTEFQALEDGGIDIIDWPLSAGWIDRWALHPEMITMRDYTDLGMYEIDINNQRWPTGQTGNGRVYYDPSNAMHNKSIEFRKAVAQCLDRDAIVRDVLKGYAYRLDVPMPPLFSDYMDMAAYEYEGLILDFDPSAAAARLDAAGFTDTNPADGIRDDPANPGHNLAPLKFYARMDDPDRRRAGEMLTAELQGIGVPVNLIITEKTVCYKQVMILYDYHLYTGGWSLSTTPDHYYDFYNTAGYWGPTVGWSLNYPGFMNHEYDAASYEVKYPATIEDAKDAAIECGYYFLEYSPIVPMWSEAAVKAYRTGWDGMVCNAAFGTDNYYSFANMEHASDTQIDWGFKSDIEQLNVISSEWLWDWNVIGLIYESMLSTNPFSLTPTEGWIADSWTVGSWDASGAPYNGDADATYITFNLRNNGTYPDVLWHNSSNNPPVYPQDYVTVDDCTFSFNFTYDCGPGVAWLYTNLANMARDKVHKLNATAFEVYFIYKSAWAIGWAGGLPIIREDIWGNITPGDDARTYDPAVQDKNSNGVVDLKEDGCGEWVYDSYNFGNWVQLKAWTNHRLSQTYIEDRLKDMYHYGAGDIDESSVVNVRDLGLMARALGTNSTHYPGTPGNWDVWNPACDLDGNGKIDGQDLITVVTNYGKPMG